MIAETILFIIIAGVLSLALAIFMYGYRSKLSKNLRWIFGALRFITIFSILLLLINPKFRNEIYTIEKPKLPVLVDNSSSITELQQTENAEQAITYITENEALNEKFDVSFYSFGTDFKTLDSLSFSEKNTNISQAISAKSEIFRNTVAPTILITDGNQTFGADYEFLATTSKSPMYPVILGDSTEYIDLRIERLNTNRYSFLKNEFPVETILVYSGDVPVQSRFTISQSNATVYSKEVSFSPSANSQTISFTLPASSVGLQKYTAQIQPLSDEKNTTNNQKRFAVEVIDQATNVLVVSDIVHPDLGALRKAIEANEQRTITFMKPSEAVSVLNEYQLIVLYQPKRSFQNIYSEIGKLNKNTFTITGTDTDWRFLNSVQDNFQKEYSNQTEEISAELNRNYGTFAMEDIGFNGFPPLQTSFGELAVGVPNETLLYQTINGISSGSPMLFTFEQNGKREALWDGEGFWRWRAQSFLNNGDFTQFDDFLGNMVQYLASNKRRSRLEVNNEMFYYNNNPIKISAQYFDNNYVFDARANLNITLKNAETNETVVFPMLLKNNFYEVDLNSLPAGEYNFTVAAADENIARSGNFTILEYNVEQQFLNANVSKLKRLAENTNGKAFFSNQLEDLLNSLLDDNRFTAIQKSEQKTTPLIDWKYLLALIVLALSAEWFIRKYNGLI